MPIEDLIRTLGRDVEIIRNGEVIRTTKGKINNNTIDFLPDENLINGDIIKTIDTQDEYTIRRVNPTKNGSGKINHITVLVD